MLNGNCLCGAVRYTVERDALSASATACHCSLCRRASGAPFVAWLTVPSASFRFVAGSPERYMSSEHGTRTFCGTCGSPLTFHSTRHQGEIDVTICTLEQPNAVAPMDHTFTRSKLAWVKLADHLPQFVASRESEA